MCVCLCGGIHPKQWQLIEKLMVFFLAREMCAGFSKVC